MSYRELAHATCDSMSMRKFLNLAPGVGISKTTIQSNLKALRDETWEQLCKKTTEYAKAKELEDGKIVRGDCTAVETNIHYPTDAGLLNDTVRVLCRTMRAAVEIIGATAQYEDRSRRAKAKLFKINNVRGEERRHPHYVELIRITQETLGYAEAMLPAIESYQCADFKDGVVLDGIASTLRTYIPRAKKVIEQAYKRIVNKEAVPGEDKIFSIFEEHTDIIVKGFQDCVFGHKVVLTTGVSGVLLDLQILDGNPKDSTLVPEILNRHKEKNEHAPQMAAFDGCFASIAKRDLAKEMKVENLTFSKNGSMDIGSLMDSPKLHRALRNFRAGVEGCISLLKRCFGFSRVLDKTLETFKAALHQGAAAYNLTLLARMRRAALQT